MAENKKQHFVSQFLLRRFSSKGTSKNINLYNRESDILVKSAAIKTQAQENYYYGEDLIYENFLGYTEKMAAPIISAIIKNSLIPNQDEIDYKRLLHFIMLYMWRTKANVDETEEYINSRLKQLSKYDTVLAKINFDLNRLVHPEPAVFNLAYHQDNWVVTYDLQPYLLINHTNKDFLISDNPLITFNPFMLKRKYYWSVNSILSKGLIMLFPLSPKHYLMLIDPFTYDVNCTKTNNINITKQADVYNINLLQSISADKILYFTDNISDKYVSSIAKEGKKNKRNETVNQEIRKPENPGGKLLFSYEIVHKLNLLFSFIREGQEAMGYKIHESIFHPRNEDIVEWVENTKKRNRKIRS